MIFMKAIFPLLSHRQLPAALYRVLGDVVNVTPNNLFTRKAIAKRKYDTVIVATETAPDRPLQVYTVKSIDDGICFPERAVHQDRPEHAVGGIVM